MSGQSGVESDTCGVQRDSDAHSLLARAFDAAPNGFIIIDEVGVVVAANSELERMFGFERGSLAGQQVETLIPAGLRESHATLRRQFIAHPEPRAMGAGRILYGRRSDGQEFPVEIGLNPLPGPQGTLVLASVVDISERIELEWAFRGLFDGSPYGLVLVDDDGTIVMVNRELAESLGYQPAALAGRPLHCLLPERHRAVHGALMAGYRSSGEARMMGQGRDLTALHSDGTELPVEIGLSRVRWQRRTMTLAAVSDISIRKRLELELRHANDHLQEFTYVASHDLRSPLRGIADLVEWIVADLGDPPPPEVIRNLTRISDRVERMENLIGDLLSYARTGSGETTLTLVDIRDVVHDILEIQPLPAGFDIELGIDVEPFQATRTPLETALRNLLGNAIGHHDRSSGRLRVEARPDDRFCEISVIDDGPGVPLQGRDRIFKLFQTLNPSRRGGSGIGLALTKRLVEVHGGRIEVISPVADGRGACFRLWWPRFPRRSRDD